MKASEAYFEGFYNVLSAKKFADGTYQYILTHLSSGLIGTFTATYDKDGDFFTVSNDTEMTNAIKVNPLYDAYIKSKPVVYPLPPTGGVN